MVQAAGLAATALLAGMIEHPTMTMLMLPFVRVRLWPGHGADAAVQRGADQRASRACRIRLRHPYDDAAGGERAGVIGGRSFRCSGRMAIDGRCWSLAMLACTILGTIGFLQRMRPRPVAVAVPPTLGQTTADEPVKDSAMRLDGQAAIVTGGASGLGAATAQRLAAGGPRGRAGHQRTAAEASAQRFGGVGIACDVADAASAEARWRRRAMRTVRPDAGELRRYRHRRPHRGTRWPDAIAAFERVIRINLIGSFNLLRLAAAEMTRSIRWRAASAASLSTRLDRRLRRPGGAAGYAARKPVWLA